MSVIKTPIDGIFIIEPRIFEDSRGFFFESFKQQCSEKYVVRGLHYQNPPYSQAKLVRCVHGRIISLALDLRIGSVTYGQCLQTELSEDNKYSEYIPCGFAHGFISLKDNSVVQYKCDNYYMKEEMCGVNVLDPSLKIEIPFDKEKAIVSDADMARPFLKDIDSPFK